MSSENKRRLRSRTTWAALGVAITALALLAVVVAVRGKTNAPAPPLARGPVTELGGGARPLPWRRSHRLGTIGGALLPH